MAMAIIEYTWATGETVKIVVDSDLETVGELHTTAAALFREAWAELEGSEDK